MDMYGSSNALAQSNNYISSYNESIGRTKDLNEAEYDSGREIDFLSNGFKLRTVNYVNLSGGIYVYMAFAKNPFKYATGIL